MGQTTFAASHPRGLIPQRAASGRRLRRQHRNHAARGRAVLKVFAQFAPDRIPAASQGTMNLISVGGRDPRNGRAYTYVETIAGGQGGRPLGPGVDGVQCNMTNTMNTPIEALEISYPFASSATSSRKTPAAPANTRRQRRHPRLVRPRP